MQNAYSEECRKSLHGTTKTMQTKSRKVHFLRASNENRLDIHKPSLISGAVSKPSQPMVFKAIKIDAMVKGGCMIQQTSTTTSGY